MYFWDYSFDNPQANLAFDEAILEYIDSLEAGDWELLRLWEMPSPCVVVGRASKLSLEVNQEACQQDGIPIFRRMSGGASIVAGPGCQMFSVLLSLKQRPECRALDGAHQCVMSRIQCAVQSALGNVGSNCQVSIQGICDLTIGGRKISGNALRLKRHWLMYHGTLLVDMPLEWIHRYLLEPPKQPEYRAHREHREFVESLAPNLPDPSKFVHEFYRACQSQWDANERWEEHPFAREYPAIMPLWLERRYNDPAWHRQR